MNHLLINKGHVLHTQNPWVVRLHHPVGHRIRFDRNIASHADALEVHSGTKGPNPIKKADDEDLLVVNRPGVLAPQMPFLCHDSHIPKPL